MFDPNKQLLTNQDWEACAEYVKRSQRNWFYGPIMTMIALMVFITLFLSTGCGGVIQKGGPLQDGIIGHSMELDPSFEEFTLADPFGLTIIVCMETGGDEVCYLAPSAIQLIQLPDGDWVAKPLPGLAQAGYTRILVKFL
jgi:hypothetical protein